MSTPDDLHAQVVGREWYHTMELAPGLVTPGWFDTRPIAKRLPWPNLAGSRCLDVGTFDGFWAFEMERRGAAEVVAIDVLDPHQWDWPVDSDDSVIEAINARKRGGDGFLTAAAAFGSKVRRVERSIYEVTREQLGQFDLIYVGSLLLHLRDPVLGLQQLRDLVAPGGQMMMLDAIDLPLTTTHPRSPVARLDGMGRPWWWRPNAATLTRFAQAAGFLVTDGPSVVFMPPGEGQKLPRVTPRSLLSAPGRQNALEHLRGDPHAWIVTSPRPSADRRAPGPPSRR